jgi:hypothetical protein
MALQDLGISPERASAHPEAAEAPLAYVVMHV